MDFIKKHKKLLIVLAVLFVFLILLILLIYKMFFAYGNDKYGARLDDIKDFPISNYTEKKLKEELKEKENVKSVKMTINGKLINILIDIEKDVDKAKEYAEDALEYFSEDERKVYDIQFFITKEEEEKNYTIIGYKKGTNDHITWSNN